MPTVWICSGGIRRASGTVNTGSPIPTLSHFGTTWIIRSRPYPISPANTICPWCISIGSKDSGPCWVPATTILRHAITTIRIPGNLTESLPEPYHSLNMNWSLLLKQNVIMYFTVSNILGFEQQYGRSYAAMPGPDGIYNSKPILPEAKRWFLVGCFITLSKDKSINQLDKIN